MLARSDVHRSIGKMTINLHRAMDQRSRASDLYKIAEREFQAQYQFSGTVGSLPVEAQVTIPFTLVFVADPGNQRDSSLDRPHVRLSTEMLYVPAGAIPYAYLQQWTQDDDFNFTGAVVVVGMNCPAIATAGATPPSDFAFKGVLHAAFQGFAAVFDADGGLAGGGMIDDPSVVN